jgi:hypothetical protein
MYICEYWYVLYLFVLVNCQRTRRQWTKMYNVYSCHIYTLLPPDDGLQTGPKHVEIW